MDFGGRKLKKLFQRKRLTWKSVAAQIQNQFYEESLLQQKILFKIRDAHNKTVRSRRRQNTIRPRFRTSTTLQNENTKKFGCVKEDCWLQTLSYKGRVSGLGRVSHPPPDEWDRGLPDQSHWYKQHNETKIFDQFYPEFTFIGSTTNGLRRKPTDYDDCVCNNMCNFKDCPTA
jgi:hypothetical protein